jgi:hypothetical protein
LDKPPPVTAETKQQVKALDRLARHGLPRSSLG